MNFIIDFLICCVLVFLFYQVARIGIIIIDLSEDNTSIPFTLEFIICMIGAFIFLSSCLSVIFVIGVYLFKMGSFLFT
jgi:hypothetical protein